MHLRVVSVGMRVHEDTGGPTGTNSSARRKVSTAARRAALERWAREGSREVDEGRESIREWAALGWAGGVSACWSGEEKGKTLKLSRLLQDLFFSFHYENHHLMMS